MVTRRTLAEMSEEERKSLLGDEYEAFMEFRARRERSAKIAKSKEMATAAITEGGKYYADYHKLDSQAERLNAQMDAIWEKALGEAEEELGLAED